jgi:ribosomal protein S11
MAAVTGRLGVSGAKMRGRNFAFDAAASRQARRRNSGLAQPSALRAEGLDFLLWKPL